MPVPTDTYRDIRKLNYLFALAALLLAGATVWLVMADYVRRWREYQREGRVWQTAMVEDAQKQAVGDGYRSQILDLEKQKRELQAALPTDKIRKWQEERAKAQAEKDALELPMAVVKGKIGPKTQEIERAVLTEGDDSPNVARLRNEVAQIQSQYDGQAQKTALLEQQIEQCNRNIAEQEAQLSQVQKQLADLNRSTETLKGKLAELSPSGAARLSQDLRNAPLLDWFNPNEKVQQVVVPGVRTDLNFVTTETVDRCITCHVNIDNPAFEQQAMIAFLERQIASGEQQPLDQVDHAVVLLDFWESAAQAVGRAGDAGLAQAQKTAATSINALRGEAKLEPIEAKDLALELARIASEEQGSDAAPRARWYKVLFYYRSDLQQLLQKQAGSTDYGQLLDLYRHQLVSVYNAQRQKQNLRPVSAARVLLAHPRLDQFVDVESKHPIKSMGCTVCHEGSGQETDFGHTAHVPRQAWVDHTTGAMVPAFLLDAKEKHGAGDPEHRAQLLPADALAQVKLAANIEPQQALALAGEAAKATPAPVSSHVAPASGAAVISQFDVKLHEVGHPAPFAPEQKVEASHLAYRMPGGQAASGQAVPMSQYWEHQYHWHAVHYADWERPMHALEYIESSCSRCHTEIYDLKDSAPKLYKGRQLFAQLGCANCHGVKEVEGALDFKKVGPSLVHVKDKLSPDMLASWIWSPKAFRPTTRMPHFFMLENNSAPVDVLRTRVEVAGITKYLLDIAPADGSPSYAPAAPPAQEGDKDKGRLLFNQLGCLACHTNLNEHGQGWIVDDLVERSGLDKSQAHKAFQGMDYNQQQWYVMEHLQDKLMRVGPELSGVGSKLKAGRTAEQARTWLNDWLANPQHYSDYSIMPSLRLSAQEANDLSAYLLAQERPDYQAQNFLDLDEMGKAMLTELVVNLKAGGGPRALAQDEIKDWNQDQKLTFLGQKMIGNYGCNGCHLISGFETAASACARLDDWGAKDPHKLDFGYYDPGFAATREQPLSTYKVAHEGVGQDAVAVAPGNAAIAQVPLAWEEIEMERRPWLYQKLHNPRIYDRGRFPNPHAELQAGDVAQAMVGDRPYDRLKMPKFFLNDEEAQELVTFVTSLRKPLVDPALQKVADEKGQQVIRGRQVATVFNCYGCHNIEGNTPHIGQFFEVNGDGSPNPNGYKWAPPRLLGEGAKVQPNWLYQFLQEVQPIRPWLTVRMPSFPVDSAQASTLVEYFSGHSRQLHDRLAKLLDPIDHYLAQSSANSVSRPWYEAPQIASNVAALRQFAVTAELAKAEELDVRVARANRLGKKWDEILNQARFLREMYDTSFPYVEQSRPELSAGEFARGEQFVSQLGCLAGQCHSLGDPDVLAQLAALNTAAAGHQDDSEEDPYGSSEEKAAGGDGKAKAASAAEEDPYGESDSKSDKAASKPADKADADPYGEEDPYAATASAAAPGVSAAPAGDPAVNFKAPNLNEIGHRIQRRFAERWVQQPTAYQPGTWMLSFFPHGESQFAQIPPAMRKELEAKYGYTGEQQRKVLLDFLYAASANNYTPGAQALTGQKPAEVEIQALTPPPAAAPAADTKPADAAQPTSKTPAAGEAAPAAAPAAKPAEPKAKSDIELQAQPTAAYEGTRVLGVVTLNGNIPRRKPVRMSTDPFCDKAHSKPPLSEGLVVNEDRSVQNVLIRVKSGLPAGQKYPLPAQRPVLDQQGCAYVPHVLAVMAGQTFVITSTDATTHNVHVHSELNGEENNAFMQGMEVEKTFTEPELGVLFKCDVHPWMTGVVHVLDNPYYSVSDVEGRYQITGLPPGKYTLEALQENLPPVQFEVEVQANTSIRADATLSGR